jgi:putative tricarboxylic transport membrane protein
MLDLWVLLISGVAGYLLRKLRFEPAILVLALALGPILERSFLQSLYLVQGDWMQMFLRPIAGGMLITGFLVLTIPALLRLLRQRAMRQSMA